MAPLSRSMELAKLAEFIGSATIQAIGLVIAGEAGIGKTTVWLAGDERARAEGFRVLSAQAGQAESVLAYATVADLIGDVEPEILEELPDVQRIALHRILLRAGDHGPETGQWVTAAAFMSVFETLTRVSPVLLAIDDVQWLDSSSRAAVEFAIRRLSGRFGVVVTERSDSDRGAGGWLQVSRPDGVTRIQVTPMSLGALHEVISERLADRYPDRRWSASQRCRVETRSTPWNSPAGVDRVGQLRRRVACHVGRSSARQNAAIQSGHQRSAAGRGLHGRSDGRTHLGSLGPALDASRRAARTTRTRRPSQHRREPGALLPSSLGSRRLYPCQRGTAPPNAPRTGEVEPQPELKARHLALGSTSADDNVLQALDAAAEEARGRGAPAAAAELVDLARRLGGDTPTRRLRAAGDHFQAGATTPAQALLESTLEELASGPLRAIASMLWEESISTRTPSPMPSASSASDRTRRRHTRAVGPVAGAAVVRPGDGAGPARRGIGQGACSSGRRGGARPSGRPQPGADPVGPFVVHVRWPPG